MRRDAHDRRSAVVRKARDEERLAVLRKGEDDLDVAGAPLGVADHDLLHRRSRRFIIIIEHEGREIPGLERLLGREPGHAPRALDVVSRRRVPRVVAGERRRVDDLQSAVGDSAAHLDRHDKARAGRLDDELRRRLGRDDGGEAACWATALGDAARVAKCGVERAAPVHTVVQAPAEVLVEGPCILHKPAHRRNGPNVPAVDRLVKRRGFVEHPLH